MFIAIDNSNFVGGINGFVPDSIAPIYCIAI